MLIKLASFPLQVILQCAGNSPVSRTPIGDFQPFLQIKSISLMQLRIGNFSLQEFGTFFILLLHLFTSSTSRVLLGLPCHW